MAKKQAAAEQPEAADKAANDEAPAKERKAKEPKEPRARTQKKEKEKPDAPSAEAAPAEAASSTAEAKPALGPGEPTKKKGKAPGVPPRRGKKLRTQMRTVDQRIRKEGPAPLRKAIGTLKQLKRSKFDETVEVHMWLGIDTTQNDQMVRGSVALPHGIGKSVRILVFCQGDNVAKAKDAGADYAGSDEFIKKIQQEGWLDFDVALATQDMMGQVSRLGKVLGPRGLMPTPKAGTVITGDVAASVREFKAGKVEYRADKGGNVHAGVGKLSFDENKLADNITAFVDQVRAVKPSGVKGNYVKSITLSATMSPGIPVQV
jgi:large subunit ribosomal protein L1